LKRKPIIREKSTRQRIIYTVIAIIAALSAFYNYQLYITNREHKQNLVNSIASKAKHDLTRYFNETAGQYQSQLEAITLFHPNPIHEDNLQAVFGCIDSHLLVGNARIHSFVNFYNSDGHLVWGKKIPAHRTLYYRNTTDASLADSATHRVVASPFGIYHLFRMPINEHLRGYFEIGIHDTEGIAYLERSTGINIISYYNKTFLGTPINDTSLITTDNTRYIYNSYGKRGIVLPLVRKTDLSKIGSRQSVRIGDKYYCLTPICDFVDPEGHRVGATLAAVDISHLQIPFQRSLAKSIVFSIMLILGAYVVFRLFFDQLTSKVFHLQQNLEKEVARRTKEIIDTNTELNQIFNSTANGLRIINKEFEIIRVNDAFCRISGSVREQIEGAKCYDVFPGVYCHTSNCPLERIKEGETNIESQEVRFRKSGKKIRCLHTAVPFLSRENELLGIIEDFKDVTEKLEAEETLRRTEDQFSAFMDNLPLGVFIKDSDGVLLYQNKYLQALLGSENLLGKNLSETLSKEWADRIKEEDRRALTLGKIEIEESMTDTEGHERSFVTHKFRFRGADQRTRIGGVSIDITGRKEAEHHQYVLSKAINNSPVSVVISSHEGIVEFINPAFSAITGYSLPEIQGKSLLALKVEYNSGSNLVKAIDSVRQGSVWRGEIHLQSKNGDHFWVSASFSPIFNRKGDLAHAIAIMEDITQRKENEKELFLAKSRAEESDRLKTAFLSNLSHEIRTPLNAIIGFSSLLSDSDLTVEEKRNLSEVVYKNSNDLLKLIEDLIEISEIETGQLTIKKSECSINKLLSDIHTTILDEDRKANGVKFNLRKEISGDDFTILTDPVRLRQVLYNLISNACKFTEKGYIEFGYALKDEENLMFYVIDTGVGIDPDKQKYIFNPFRQADDSNTRRFSGMGLGLAISKHIVEKLGGRIWFTSAPGSGTTFYFTIPYVPVRFKFEPEPRTERKRAYDWKNKTILLADDIDANYVFLKAAIKPTNAEIIWAKTGVEAVNIVKNNPDINLVLMDIVMPEMDGFEATRQIKRFKTNLPIVCQTAYPTSENYKTGLECGFDSFLAKPIKLQGMLQEIDKFMSNN